MILQALAQYYEDLRSRGEIAEPGWAPAKISYVLCLDAEGRLTQIIPTMVETEDLAASADRAARCCEADRRHCI